MNIFISWSKNKSEGIARETKKLLQNLIDDVNIFISSVDIHGGDDVQNKIIDNIIHCDILVLVFTKENKKSPWLLFEAGYARALNKKAIPILFYDDPNWHYWIDNPMNIAKDIKIHSNDFIESLFHSFSIEDSKKNRDTIRKYKRKIIEIDDKYRKVDKECEDIVEMLTYDKTFILESPYFDDKTAFFHTSFETFQLFKIIVNYFLYTGKYLWIYGRKNMKLFSGNYKELFGYLEEKAKKPYMGGIDFKCLFLDPESQEVEHAHIQQKIFKDELKATLVRAEDVYKNILSSDVCHMDETPLQVISNEANQSYIWGLSSSKYDKSPYVYIYEPNRKHENAKKILNGFKGYVYSDGYNTYKTIPNVTNVGCFAHARRKYMEIIKASDKDSNFHKLALEGKRFIDRLYSIEHKAKKNNLKQIEIYELR